MDLEQLTKHQIILLTLLVSFMTSIATGIVTVSLMNQAPPEVTHTINQIIQQTVEKVVPVSQGAATVNTVQKTVVIKSDDLAVQSIASVQKSIIRIVAKGDDKLVARGVIITKNGKALTDHDALANAGVDAFEAYLSDGERVAVNFNAASSSAGSIAVVSVVVGTSSGFEPATLADVSKLGLGQGVIRIGGVGNDTVGEGVIASLPEQVKDAPRMVEASVSSMTPGSVLLSIFGEVIGLSTTASEAQGSSFYDMPSIGGSSASTTPATKSSS